MNADLIGAVAGTPGALYITALLHGN